MRFRLKYIGAFRNNSEHFVILDFFFSYYYKRTTSHSSTISSTTCTSTPSTSHSASDPAASSPSGSSHSSSALGNSEDLTKSLKPSTVSHEGLGAPGLADFMRGVHVYFYNLAATEKKKLARYLITYPFTFHLYPHIQQSQQTSTLQQHIYHNYIYKKACWCWRELIVYTLTFLHIWRRWRGSHELTRHSYCRRGGKSCPCSGSTIKTNFLKKF